jgi:hypothetical protein
VGSGTTGNARRCGVRLLATTAALVWLASPAAAQDRGSFALDAMTTPGRHFGLGYYLTDGVSLRPSLGFGYAGGYGTSFNLGTDLRWEILPGSRVSPYATAGFNYFRDPLLARYDSSGSLLPAATSNVTRYGAGLGVRARLKYKLSLVAEGRMMNSELRDLTGYYGLQPGAHFEAAVGISYVLN